MVESSQNVLAAKWFAKWRQAFESRAKENYLTCFSQKVKHNEQRYMSPAPFGNLTNFSDVKPNAFRTLLS